MKNIIFTNSEELNRLFNVENYKSSVRTSLSKIIKLNKERLEDIDSELYPFVNAISPQFPFQMDRQDLFFVMLNEKKEIVAALVLGYNENGWSKDKKYLMHSISVEKEYQGQGYARKLIDIMFNYCSDKGITKIKQSPYTKQGKKKIKKVFKEVSQNYKNVSFFDTSKNSLFN